MPPIIPIFKDMTNKHYINNKNIIIINMKIMDFDNPNILINKNDIILRHKLNNGILIVNKIIKYNNNIDLYFNLNENDLENYTLIINNININNVKISLPELDIKYKTGYNYNYGGFCVF